jgi:replicative DNA helicase
VLAALLQHGEFAAQFVPMLERNDFATEDGQAIFEAIARLVAQSAAVSSETVLAEVDSGARGLLAELSLEEVPQEQVERSLQGAVRRIVEARLRTQQRALQQRLTQPMTEEEQQAILREMNELENRKSKLAAERIVG